MDSLVSNYISELNCHTRQTNQSNNTMPGNRLYWRLILQTVHSVVINYIFELFDCCTKARITTLTCLYSVYDIWMLFALLSL